MSFVSRYLEPTLVEWLNHLQHSARSVVEGSISGLHRSPVKGASIEFCQYRLYRYFGLTPLRRIHGLRRLYFGSPRSPGGGSTPSSNRLVHKGLRCAGERSI